MLGHKVGEGVWHQLGGVILLDKMRHWGWASMLHKPYAMPIAFSLLVFVV